MPYNLQYLILVSKATDRIVIILQQVERDALTLQQYKAEKTFKK